MDRVKIVEASVEDISGIAKVHVDSWKETYKGIVSNSFLSTLTYENREKQWKEAFEFHKSSDVWHMYVAKNKAGEIIGFISGGRSREDKTSGEIYAVYLLQNCHGQGIGKSLMISSMQHLARAGFETCQVCVLKENPALHFYKKLGANDGVIKPITIGTQTLDEAVLSWNSLLDALIKCGRSHPCVVRGDEIRDDDNSAYPGSAELLSQGAAFGRFFKFNHIGIHEEVLKPGRRSSWPHAEKTEDEFAYIIEGNPDVWIDGVLYRLKPGDAIGFKSGTGIAHTFINNTDKIVKFLMVGDKTKPDNKISYPLNEDRNKEIGDHFWSDYPKRAIGPHDGKPSARKL